MNVRPFTFGDAADALAVDALTTAFEARATKEQRREVLRHFAHEPASVSVLQCVKTQFGADNGKPVVRLGDNLFLTESGLRQSTTRPVSAWQTPHALKPLDDDALDKLDPSVLCARLEDILREYKASGASASAAALRSRTSMLLPHTGARAVLSATAPPGLVGGLVGAMLAVGPSGAQAFPMAVASAVVGSLSLVVTRISHAQRGNAAQLDHLRDLADPSQPKRSSASATGAAKP